MLKATEYIDKKRKEVLMSIGTIILLIIIGIFAWIILTTMGLYMCNDNNAIGIVFLFITLNLIGLLLGIAIIYNKKQIKDNNED